MDCVDEGVKEFVMGFQGVVLLPFQASFYTPFLIHWVEVNVSGPPYVFKLRV